MSTFDPDTGALAMKTKRYLKDRKNFYGHFHTRPMLLVFGRNVALQFIIRLQTTLEQSEQGIADAFDAPEEERDEAVRRAEKAQHDALWSFFLQGPNASPWPELMNAALHAGKRELMIATSMRFLEAGCGRFVSDRALDKLLKGKSTCTRKREWLSPQRAKRRSWWLLMTGKDVRGECTYLIWFA